MIKMTERYGTTGDTFRDYPELVRLYERLRKRSFRVVQEYERESGFRDVYGRKAHKTYLATMREVLDEVAATV